MLLERFASAVITDITDAETSYNVLKDVQEGVLEARAIEEREKQ